MRTVLAVAVLTSLMLSDGVWSQEQTEASGEKIERTLPVRAENPSQRCESFLELEYYQKNTHAYVKSTLKNDQCAASSGSYVVRIKYRPDEGEQGQIEYEETWSRNDDADIVTEKDYFVGENLDVRRVSGAKLRCTCSTEEAVESEPTSERLRHKDRG
jgi:hypothetical protein